MKPGPQDVGPLSQRGIGPVPRGRLKLHLSCLTEVEVDVGDVARVRWDQAKVGNFLEQASVGRVGGTEANPVCVESVRDGYIDVGHQMENPRRRFSQARKLSHKANNVVEGK